MIVCFGEALIDFFPETTGQPLEDCERFVRHVGGAPTNVALGAARLGARVRLISAVGDDPFGVFLRRALDHDGVLTDSLLIDPTRRTGLTFVAVARDGSRRFLSVRVQSAIDNFAPTSLREEWLDGATLVHVGSATLAVEPSRSTTMRLVQQARARGIAVAVDLNWRPHLWADPAAAQPLVRELLARADLVKIADDELEPLFATADPDAGAAAIAALGPGIVVVTLGPGGSRLYARGACVAQPAPVVTVVDATGAGDGFWAGVLSTLDARLPSSQSRAALAALELATLSAATARGNQIGALVVTQLGATTAVRRSP